METVGELPLTHRILILVGLLVTVVGGYYYFFYSGLGEKLSEVEEEVKGQNGLKIQIAQRQAQARNLDKYKVEVAKLDKELNTAVSELPDKKQIAALLSRVSDKARDAGLNIQSFKPASSRTKDFYAEVPVNIEVSGTFHQVATFFDEVGRLDRIVNIGAYNIANPTVGEKEVSLSATVTTTAFRFLDESERKAENSKKKGKKKKRGR